MKGYEMYKRLLFILIITFVCTSFGVHAQTHNVQKLTLEEAQQIADAAEQRAREDNWNVVIAIVDQGGHLITLRRIDGVQTASIDIAIEKARTAVFYKRSTKVFQDRVSDGEIAILSLPDMMPFGGGLPVWDDNLIIGGIGVSGVTAEQDEIIARAGLEALQ